jgi:hypothetical protein
MNQEKYFTDGFLPPFSGSRPIDSSTYRRALPALQAVEGAVARQAIGQLDKTADRWFRCPGKPSDIRRPPFHRKAGGQGSSAAARILETVPARTNGSRVSLRGGQVVNQETSAMRAIRRKLGPSFNSNSSAMALFSPEL